MAMENKRITQLSTERLTLTSGDYVIVDDADNGSAKYRLDRLKETDTTLSVSGMAADAAATGQAISAEATARGNAVTAEAEERAAAVAAEAEARSEADTALGNDVEDLKSALDINDIDIRSTEGDQSFTPPMVRGSKVASTTGIISEDPNMQRCEYTPTMSAVSLSFSAQVINICFYKRDKTYIGGSTNVTAINIPSGAFYFIFTVGINVNALTVTLTDAVPALYGVKKDLEGTGKIIESIMVRGEQFPNNLVSVFSEWVDNAYILYATGGVATNQPAYFATDFIPVSPGVAYKANRGRNLAWYNSDKTYLSGESGTGIQTGVTAPDDAAYIRFTVNKIADGITSPAMLYFTESSLFSADVQIPGLIVTSTPWCYGKKINWIGDSIVDGADFDEEVCNALGLVKASEYGINGSTIALNANGTDGRTALCVRYANMSNDADIVAVSCGTNDFEYAWCPIGTIDDPDDGTSNTTFYGALKTLCKGLIDKYPQKVIFFTTPIKRAQAFMNGDGGEYTPDGVTITPFSKNKYGKTLGDYADIIKEVCGYYSIPVLDMYRESLLNPHLASQQNMFDNVFTHPNVTGQKIMARRVCGWLTQLGYVINGLS